MRDNRGGRLSVRRRGGCSAKQDRSGFEPPPAGRAAARLKGAWCRRLACQTMEPGVCKIGPERRVRALKRDIIIEKFPSLMIEDRLAILHRRRAAPSPPRRSKRYDGRLGRAGLGPMVDRRSTATLGRPGLLRGARGRIRLVPMEPRYTRLQRSWVGRHATREWRCWWLHGRPAGRASVRPRRHGRFCVSDHTRSRRMAPRPFIHSDGATLAGARHWRARQSRHAHLHSAFGSSLHATSLARGTSNIGL